jgi:hypothetical protein
MNEFAEFLPGPRTIEAGLEVLVELDLFGVREESARFQSG